MSSTVFSFKLTPEASLKTFKNILPEDLIKELEKAIKSNDEEKSKTLMEKVKLIVTEYQTKVEKPELEDEQVLWRHKVTKGIFHKEVIEDWVITNFRAYIRCYIPKTEMFSVGLAVADTVVMNQHRNSSGNRVGTFTGVGGYGFAGTGISTSSSTSRTYGDLAFFSFGGKQIFCFKNISDPQGVRRMIETIKKQR
jgi:hypothetical protein